ncbi:hypothetical protein [Actinomadura montaniterrae]|uniref:DUF2637 domain-containing protein n=1 Tax=Actinomadura montaniterrae TaxID=1803903 RepID=A0A6L3VZ05_9ACTN|nr:hypothetical protein [Actinomadura montaniterrae]KAB2380651.1 hypothetical protein F9B16_17255 [Actinomadura montaniterrae]KAB2386429.1 hypothetical protein F9B16_07090 [Actinomadura montaniterrae]
MTPTYDPLRAYERQHTVNGHHATADSPDADATGGQDRYGRPVQVFNLRYLPGFLARRRANGAERDPRAEHTDRAGGWLLAVASVLLLILAAAQGYVSYRAQYSFVHAQKHEHAASMLEALGLDAAAVIFALLALAQARLGRPAVAERALNLACVLGSLFMNALSADPGSAKSVAAWVLPAALYAAASDRLIAVVRQRALAGRDGAEDGSPLAAARGLALWALRFGMAPWSTVREFRTWVLDEAPVAPGRRALSPRPELPALPAPRDTGRDSTGDAGRDGEGDATGDSNNDRTGDSTPDADPDADRDTAGDAVRDRTPRRARPRRRTGGATTADKARALLAADPTMSGAELGRRLKVTPRTGQRLYAQITADPAKGDDAR